MCVQVQEIIGADIKLGLAISICNVQKSSKMLLTIPTRNTVIGTEYSYWPML